MKKKNIALFFERLAKANPDPKTELEYGSDYQLLVAVVLSAQTTDRSVNQATARLFPKAPTPQAMVALGEVALADTIQTLGLFRSKARHVIALSQQLMDRHEGRVPQDRKALEALPGVGRKTANVVLNTLFGEPVMAVDTHIFRLGNRTGLAPGKTVRAVEDGLMNCIPKAYLKDAHHWLILHGRYVCTARKPRCPACIVSDLCAYVEKTPHPQKEG
jgi:endonuclease III